MKFFKKFTKDILGKLIWDCFDAFIFTTILLAHEQCSTIGGYDSETFSMKLSRKMESIFQVIKAA